MAGFVQTMQARSKPRLRFHSDGKWYCYREHRTARGIYLGRITGAGESAREAFDDLALLERDLIASEQKPPGKVRQA